VGGAHRISFDLAAPSHLYAHFGCLRGAVPPEMVCATAVHDETQSSAPAPNSCLLSAEGRAGRPIRARTSEQEYYAVASLIGQQSDFRCPNPAISRPIRPDP
jgi:hypothetical protein